MLRTDILLKISWILLLIAPTTVAEASMDRAAVAHSDFQISGTLVDGNTGQPISRARVAIAPVTERDAFTTVITHQDGQFFFSNVVPGKYTLTAQARGYLLESFNQHDAFSSSIVVGPDLDSTNLVFRIYPEGSISGVVLDEAGEPVRGAQVHLYSTGLSVGTQATRSRGATTSSDEGLYHFGHLPPGRYLVAVTARPWYAQNQSTRREPPSGGSGTQVEQASSPLDVAYAITFFPNVIDASAASTIVLGRGEKFAADIRLQPVAALHIHIPRDTSDPERGNHITFQKQVLDGPALGVNFLSYNNQQNEFVISGVAPGHYTMRTLGVSGTMNDASPSREVDISDNAGIEDRLGASYVPVSARLQFEGGAPAGQITLQLLDKKSRQAFNQRAGNDGEVQFKQGVLPASYEVSLFTNSGAYIKSISATGATITGRTLDIRSSSDVKLEITAGNGQGQVTGTALRQGKPFAGAMIVLVPADPGHNQVLFRRDQSDSDGTFTLANVVPGTYTLLALENGWDLEWLKPSVLRPYMRAGAPVQVEVNGKYNIKVAVQ